MTGSLPLPSIPLPSIEALKDQAKRLRAKLTADGKAIGHSEALEALAHQYGYKDWNTLHATVGNRPPVSPVALGTRVSGHYLGQPFEGTVLGVQILATPGRFRLTLDFDAPVDVVTFDSFSNFRKRIVCVVDSKGKTAERTTNGQPQLQLKL